MSGGVDSSVAAALLKQAGFDVVGVMMRFWHAPRSLGGVGKEENKCCSLESERMARLVAKKIGIPFYVLNVEKEFKKKVVDYFLREYKNGKTPNPCVVCNKEIKFGLLLEKALKLGADFIATGHYAQIFRSRSATNFFPAVGSPLCPSTSLRTSGPRPAKSLLPRLFTACDESKDQSYFLWQLNQKQLKHVLFPVGNYTKPEVRELAKKFNLPTAETPESQEVCFVSDSTNNFLKKYLKPKAGNIVDLNNKIIGKHNGLCFYTIGQRKGIELQQGPWFVVDKNFKKDTLVVSKNQKDLFKKELVAKNVNWIFGTAPKLPLKIKVKIRYGAKEASATIYKIKAKIYKLEFTKPQRAITPGQSAVFYRGKELLGGGAIDN